MEQLSRILICHRNRLFADCLARILSDGTDFEITIPPSDCRGDQLKKSSPQIAIVDAALCLDPSTSPIPRLRNAGTTRVLMVVAEVNDRTIQDCVEADVDGCVLEESSLEEFVKAVEKISQGDRWFSPEIVNEAFSLLGSLARERLHDQVATCDLTTRELEVVQLIAWEKLSNKQIAQRLCVSVYTVKNHVHNIIEKLGVNDRFEAAEYASKKRWLTRLSTRI